MKKAIDTYKICRMSNGKNRYSYDSRPSSTLMKIEERSSRATPLIRESI